MHRRAACSSISTGACYSQKAAGAAGDEKTPLAPAPSTTPPPAPPARKSRLCCCLDRKEEYEVMPQSDEASADASASTEAMNKSNEI
jgi:hypothetical protein